MENIVIAVTGVALGIAWFVYYASRPRPKNPDVEYCLLCDEQAATMTCMQPSTGIVGRLCSDCGAQSRWEIIY